jgi:transposase
MKRKPSEPTFKPYTMAQPSLIPPSWDELIPAEHVVRVVNRAIERIDLEPLLKKYKGGGASSYHPGMMLKVLVYAYTQKIYSSRQIAKALRENVNFMWMSGGNRPDFRTINGFRVIGTRRCSLEIWQTEVCPTYRSDYHRTHQGRFRKRGIRNGVRCL